MSTEHERRVERILDDIRKVLYKILDALTPTADEIAEDAELTEMMREQNRMMREFLDRRNEQLD